MHTATAMDLGERATSADYLVRLVPGASTRLAHLSNDELLTRTRCLVGNTNQVLAALLEHLAEVEARGLHREKRCASLYTYCIYELRFSEDAASRRASAARVVRQFPAALEAVSRGEIHLTGLLQVAPILTEANHLEVLAHAQFRTKKEIAKLVRRIAPLPEVPDRIEPLGSPLQKKLRSPSWAELVEAFSPSVRELRPGERPSDWESDSKGTELDLDVGAALARQSSPAPARESGDEREPSAAPARESDDDVASALLSLDVPSLYQMQFTTTEEHAELVEKAKTLLSHGPRKLSLGELHLQAMRLLVETLEKKRFGAKHPPCKPSWNDGPARAPRQRGRSIPAAVRRQVYDRDQGRCTFVDDCGERCAETHLIQMHHLLPFASGGEHTPSNLTLRCAAHNALAAEQDFGRDYMKGKRDGARHEARTRVKSG